MSAIYFHSQDGTALVRGSERAYMSGLCGDLMLGVIGDIEYAREWLLPLLPADCYARAGPKATLEMYLRNADGDLIVDGERIDTFLLALNTAWALGGDPLRLLARLHGQCEIHCWVDGPDRTWLAGIIREGRKSDLYHAEQGWEDVANLLETRDDEPVVCSYSVCDQFPNFGCLPAEHPLKQSHDERRFEWFDDLEVAETWATCMRGLREQGGGLQIQPGAWDSFAFGDGQSAFTLKAGLRAKSRGKPVTP